MNHDDDLSLDVFTARQLIRVGAHDAAAQYLAARLRHFDPSAAAGNASLAQAARLYTSIVDDPAWVAYLRRHHRQHPADATTTPYPRCGAPIDEPTVEAPTVAGGAGSVLDLGHRSWSVDLDQAQAAHRQGHCGEAIRSADRALHAWRASGSARLSSRGVTLIVGVAAMMSACGRDTDARTVIATNSTYLPAPGSGDRHAFAVYALQAMDAAAEPHPAVCPAHTRGAWATALAATDDDTLPWAHRRDHWWHLLTYGSPPGHRSCTAP
jgi:hypothetical protein